MSWFDIFFVVVFVVFCGHFLLAVIGSVKKRSQDLLKSV